MEATLQRAMALLEQASSGSLVPYRSAIGTVLAALRRGAEAPASKWIAIGERLPVDGASKEADPWKTILVLVARPKSAYVLEVAVGYLYEGQWYITREQSEEDDFVDNTVTHWQPLPASPVVLTAPAGKELNHA